MFSRPPQASGQDKARVDELLTKLQADLQDEKLTAEARQSLLEQLKVLGRDPSNSESIFAKKGIATLCEYGFDVAELEVSQEALRCLANAMLLQEAPRQYLLDLGYGGKAAQRLRNDDRNDEFLISRIIFLLTYKTTVDLVELVEKHELANSICRPELILKFTSSVPDLFSILSHQKLPSPPLQGAVSATINALMNMQISDETCPNKARVEQLIDILDLSTKAYSESELEQTATPLLLLLRKIQGKASADLREHMQSLLLPNEKARSKPLGQGDSLPSRLLRLSISPAQMKLCESISGLFYELSGSNPTTFIHNIGYGYAAGYLSTHKIEVPETMMKADAQGADINPVTGQRLAAEPTNPEPEMTDEEKEREAERLFVLFERLKATGVVDVENPVHQAMREGRFDN
ncbi:hypothetical protein E4T52_02087 [Aureobasidium sp. EXF-3400]|nr:hypothetical protein E4T51_02032 [Aureobasidium sp. EXF-12344]KAI4782946.1 hypothetical protein E4T52_02087 [Aureobasidium sp. EXF-3400]